MFLDSRTEFYLPCRSNLLILTQKSGHLGLVTSLVLLHWYAVSVLAVMSCVKGCSVSWMQTFQLGLLQVNRICWFWREIFGLLFWQHMEANDLETHKTPWKAVMCILNFKLTTISKKAGRKSGVCRPENTILTWGRTDHYSVTMSNSLLLGKRFFVPSQLSSLRSDPSNMSEFSLSSCLYIVMCALIEDAGSEDDCLGFLVTTLWFFQEPNICALWGVRAGTGMCPGFPSRALYLFQSSLGLFCNTLLALSGAGWPPLPPWNSTGLDQYTGTPVQNRHWDRLKAVHLSTALTKVCRMWPLGKNWKSRKESEGELGRPVGKL